MKAYDKWLTVPLAAGLAVAAIGGCGTDGGADAGGSERIVVGMSDRVLATDPAAGYDPGSWLLFNNVFQSLLSFPKGATTPQPEAAERCGFDKGDSTVYHCTLREGLEFSNGNPLTSEDVRFSFERALKIDDENGPAPLLSTIKRVETPDARTVVFVLKVPDATFPSKIASGAGSIVDHREYRADRLRTDGGAVGSGPYRLDSFDDGKAVFSVNPGYKGSARIKNGGVTLRFYDGDRKALAEGLVKGDVDVAYRGLAAEDIRRFEDSPADGGKGVEVVEGSSAEVQYLVFNMKDPVAGRLGVRRAIAHLVDRRALVRDVHHSTATPLYSVVPAGILGHNTAFFDRYGDRPRPDLARKALRDEGIEGKVEITLHSTPSRYGPGTNEQTEAIAAQLNRSGLFEARVESVEYGRYEKEIRAGRYGVYVKGWVPDYPDPDNFAQPFFGRDNVLGNHYENAEITGRIIPDTAAAADRGAARDDFDRLQDIVAEDVPLLPLWQAKQYAVARGTVSGLEWTLDASTVFRFWEIGKD
ncbi:ABC transporter substrate-binding protein [Streptomyces sp. MRC013]|uniref:ABC transporter substrate-binding protein n=1 Tax=Streptomyces sp. MRC013 TaxID=2898276 RepID=UPI0020265841|nr:ABC transporter substrate-binding protein [Streptomyces sp. MRC013]URM91946.1 ABC transporter substrate-binding protein [Streptomyces sp. MRC013]